MSYKIKKATKKKKICFIGFMIFAIMLLVTCIKSAYAYYQDSTSFNMLSSLVGDFDTGNGDINIVVYRETEKGTYKYTKSASVPAMEYSWDKTRTTCTIKTCVEGSSGDCHYTFDATARTFSLTSKQKVTCKFYFNQVNASDINVYLMQEDPYGTDGSYGSKKYTLVNEIPAVGYKYSNNYTCDTPANTTVTYDANLKKFTVSSPTKNKCYAYFNSDGTAADINANVYVKDIKSSEYVLVNSIPANNTYKMATDRTSACYTDGVKTEAGISYEDGYINIDDLAQKQDCEVYLDIQE